MAKGKSHISWQDPCNSFVTLSLVSILVALQTLCDLASRVILLKFIRSNLSSTQNLPMAFWFTVVILTALRSDLPPPHRYSHDVIYQFSLPPPFPSSLPAAVQPHQTPAHTLGLGHLLFLLPGIVFTLQNLGTSLSSSRYPSLYLRDLSYPSVINSIYITMHLLFALTTIWQNISWFVYCLLLFTITYLKIRIAYIFIRI